MAFLCETGKGACGIIEELCDFSPQAGKTWEGSGQEGFFSKQSCVFNKETLVCSKMGAQQAGTGCCSVINS